MCHHGHIKILGKNISKQTNHQKSVSYSTLISTSSLTSTVQKRIVITTCTNFNIFANTQTMIRPYQLPMQQSQFHWQMLITNRCTTITLPLLQQSISSQVHWNRLKIQMYFKKDESNRTIITMFISKIFQVHLV